ncbi:MAG TPA: type II toxin-antitoxin system VapC family toxin [Leptospiraceae bacterium]|nr:type II toxin-antitoxin system VapC family toxin [Leptospiraceae bacterium]HRG74241.1 type II toxin-antitoxin system VapC family toxin [Leptospiraceae bacterium]
MVIDTSIFIEFLRTKNKDLTTLKKIPKNTIISISTVTLYELYMGATNTEKKNDVELLTRNIPIISFEKEIAIKAAEIFLQLKKSNQLIEFRDIFIAATSIIHKTPLLTLNKKHFINIPDIELFEIQN